MTGLSFHSTPFCFISVLNQGRQQATQCRQDGRLWWPAFT